MENIQKTVTDELNTLTENDFQYCYDQWKKLWNHCVNSQGSNFEGLVISDESNTHLNKNQYIYFGTTLVCRICGRQNGTGTDFSPTRCVSPVITIAPLLLTHMLIIYHPATQRQKLTVPLYKSVYTYMQGKSIKEVK